MGFQPFLSHKSQQRALLAVLHRELRLRGAGGWVDREQLPLGEKWRPAFPKAIAEETGGFIWLATKKSLQSSTITKIELPAGLDRARQTGGLYPFVVVYIDIKPGDRRIVEAIGEDYATQLGELQGVTREGNESYDALVTRAAARYVRDTVKRAGSPLTVSLGRPAGDESVLRLDWSGELNQDGFMHAGTDREALRAAARDVQASCIHAGTTEVIVNVVARVCSCALLGAAFPTQRQFVLTVRGSGNDVRSDLQVSQVPVVVELGSFGDGRPLVAASVSADTSTLNTITDYAEQQQACAAWYVEHMGAASAEDVVGVAHAVGRQLRQVQDRHLDKALIVRGPAVLAVLIAHLAGAASFEIMEWDRGRGYRPGIRLP